MSSKHTGSMGLVVGGKLKLKGDKKRKKEKKRARLEGADAGSDSDADAQAEAEAAAAAAEYSADPVVGTGKLTTSGVVVMGHDTEFVKELSVGDTLLVSVKDRYRNTETNESRRVNMVLGRSARNALPPYSPDRLLRRNNCTRSLAQRGGALLLRLDEPKQLHVCAKGAGPRGDPSSAQGGAQARQALGGGVQGGDVQGDQAGQWTLAGVPT